MGTEIRSGALGIYGLVSATCRLVGAKSKYSVVSAMAGPLDVLTIGAVTAPFFSKESHYTAETIFSSILAGAIVGNLFLDMAYDQGDKPSSISKISYAAQQLTGTAALCALVFAAAMGVEYQKLCAAAALVHLGILGHKFYEDASLLKLREAQKADGVKPDWVTDLTEEVGDVQYLGDLRYYKKVVSILLTGNSTNNPLLFAPPGSGKTALVEFLAYQIKHGKEPDLEGWKVYVADATALSAGTKYKGTQAEKILALQRLLKGKKAILFIDEIHQTMGREYTSDGEGNALANDLNNIIADRNVRVIGATTNYEKPLLQARPAFFDRFYKIELPQMSPKMKQTIINQRVTQSGLAVPNNFFEKISAINLLHGEYGLRADLRLFDYFVVRIKKEGDYNKVLSDELEDIIIPIQAELENYYGADLSKLVEQYVQELPDQFGIEALAWVKIRKLHRENKEINAQALNGIMGQLSKVNR